MKKEDFESPVHGKNCCVQFSNDSPCHGLVICYWTLIQGLEVAKTKFYMWLRSQFSGFHSVWDTLHVACVFLDSCQSLDFLIIWRVRVLSLSRAIVQVPGTVLSVTVPAAFTAQQRTSTSTCTVLSVFAQVQVCKYEKLTKRKHVLKHRRNGTPKNSTHVWPDWWQLALACSPLQVRLDSRQLVWCLLWW